MRLILPRPAASSRGGFSLPELLVVLVLFSVIAGALMSMLVGQQRFYRGTSDIVEVRSQLRQAASILPVDLRSVSPAGGDLLAITDSSMSFRSTIGSAVACLIPTPGGSEVILPPLALARRSVLTSWLAPPASGDTAYIYDEGPTSAASDDSWRAYAVASLAESVNACPTSSGFTTAADLGKASFVLTLASNLSPTITAGAPMRFARRSYYSLYRAADDRWYLGYCSPDCTAASPIAPVAGPLRPYAAPSSGASGATFTYYTSAGAPTTTPAQVARVDVVLRAQTETPVPIAGRQQGVYRDSLRLTVALRNRG